MKRVFALAVLWPTLAFAITPPHAVEPTTPPGQTTMPHVCGQEFYPPEAIKNGAEGNTIVVFHISAQGHPVDVFVAKSSGSLALDYAATRCVPTWIYTPATLNGKPIEVPWAARVEWRLNGALSAPLPPNAIGAPHVCVDPPETKVKKLLPTVIAFTITKAGSTSGINVLQASGDPALDEYGMSCVGAWLYEPAKAHGEPVDVTSFVTMSWSPPQ